jgi:hypothetical protein
MIGSLQRKQEEANETANQWLNAVQRAKELKFQFSHEESDLDNTYPTLLLDKKHKEAFNRLISEKKMKGLKASESVQNVVWYQFEKLRENFFLNKLDTPDNLPEFDQKNWCNVIWKLTLELDQMKKEIAKHSETFHSTSPKIYLAAGFAIGCVALCYAALRYTQVNSKIGL